MAAPLRLNVQRNRSQRVQWFALRLSEPSPHVSVRSVTFRTPVFAPTLKLIFAPRLVGFGRRADGDFALIIEKIHVGRRHVIKRQAVGNLLCQCRPYFAC